MSGGKHVFVTVGTTKFDKLIATITRDDILDQLSALGFTSITFQTGTGSSVFVSHNAIRINNSQFYFNFAHEIKKADLVISHAGAGTCLEVLKQGKPLIVVINEDLMDNHQLELAQQLQDSGYLHYCSCSNIDHILDRDLTNFRKYVECDVNLFSNYLDKCMGFSN